MQNPRGPEPEKKGLIWERSLHCPKEEVRGSDMAGRGVTARVRV
jgi:hypothetical protein